MKRNEKKKKLLRSLESVERFRPFRRVRYNKRSCTGMALQLRSCTVNLIPEGNSVATFSEGYNGLYNKHKKLVLGIPAPGKPTVPGIAMSHSLNAATNALIIFYIKEEPLHCREI